MLLLISDDVGLCWFYFFVFVFVLVIILARVVFSFLFCGGGDDAISFQGVFF